MKRRMLQAVISVFILLSSLNTFAGQPSIGVPALGSPSRVIHASEIKSVRYDYVGCFKDAAGDLSNRALDGAWVNKWDHMELQTPKWCVDYCEPQGFAYAGWVAPWCSCGNNPNKYGPADPGACTAPCPGDQSQACGGTGVISVYATGLAGNAPVGGGCGYLDETFSGTSGANWTANAGTWSILGERLEARITQTASMGSYATGFLPPDLFSVEVNVEWVAGPDLHAGYGIFPYTSGGVFFQVDGHDVSGVGAIVYPNRGTARLLAWDVPAQAWYESPELTLPPTVTSIGVAYLSDRVVLKLNGANTALSFAGDFSYAPGNIDTLWLFAQNAETVVWFDNVCAGPSAGTPQPTNPYTLAVTPSGTGTGVVSSTPSGINCGADCTESYPAGTVVTLAATPASGSNFVGWSGGGCSGTGGCTVTMGSDQAIAAQFDAAVDPSLIPMPTGLQVIYYDRAPTPVLSADPSAARPIALGPAANGEDTFNLEIGIKEFVTPVDMYLGAYSPAFDPSLIFLFTKDNALVSASDGLVPWRTGASVETHENIFTSIPIDLLPPGMWNFLLIVTPSSNPSGQYLWWTRLLSPFEPGSVYVRFSDAFGEEGTFEAILRAFNKGYSAEQILDAGMTGRLSVTGEVADIFGAGEPPAFSAPGFTAEPTAAVLQARAKRSDPAPPLDPWQAQWTFTELKNKMISKCLELTHPALKGKIGLVIVGWIIVGYDLDQILDFLISNQKLSWVCNDSSSFSLEEQLSAESAGNLLKSCAPFMFTEKCELIKPADLGKIYEWYGRRFASRSTRQVFSGDGPCSDAPPPTPAPVSLPITYGGWGNYRTTREHYPGSPNAQYKSCDSQVPYRIHLATDGTIDFEVKFNIYVDSGMECISIPQPSWTDFPVRDAHSNGIIAFDYGHLGDIWTINGTYDPQGLAGLGKTLYENSALKTTQTLTFNLVKCETRDCCDKLPDNCQP